MENGMGCSSSYCDKSILFLGEMHTWVKKHTDYQALVFNQSIFFLNQGEEWLLHVLLNNR